MGNYILHDAVNGAVGGALNEVLLKEDVSDLITNLFPLDTCLHQALGTQPMPSTFTEYPVDTFTSILRTTAVVGSSAIASPDATLLAKPEGHTFTTSTPQYPAKLKSVAEIQGRQFGVSDTERAMAMYAIGDRFNYEMMKVMQNVVNDFEHSFWWSKGTGPEGFDFDSGGATFNARQTQGLMWWILKSGLARSKENGATTPGICTTDTCTDGHGNAFGGSSVLGSAAGTWAYDANGFALDSAMFKDQLMAKWWALTGRGADGAIGFASPRVKSLMSQFALSLSGNINDRTIDAASRRLVDTIDYFQTDYGTVGVNLCRYLSQGGQTISVTSGGAVDTAITTTVACDEALVFIHPEYWKIGKVRGVSFTPLAKTGDFESGLIRGEQALVCRNPQGGVAIVNCVP